MISLCNAPQHGVDKADSPRIAQLPALLHGAVDRPAAGTRSIFSSWNTARRRISSTFGSIFGSGMVEHWAMIWSSKIRFCITP